MKTERRCLTRGSQSHKTGGEAAWLMAGGIPERRSGLNGILYVYMLIEIAQCMLWYPLCGSSCCHNLKGTNGVSNWHEAFFSDATGDFFAMKTERRRILRGSRSCLAYGWRHPRTP